MVASLYTGRTEARVPPLRREEGQGTLKEGMVPKKAVKGGINKAC